MAETTTITRPAPVLEASLTNFLKAIDPLVGQKINVGAFAPQIAAEFLYKLWLHRHNCLTFGEKSSNRSHWHRVSAGSNLCWRRVTSSRVSTPNCSGLSF